MKKFALLMVFVLAVAAGAFAGNKVELKSGDKSSFAQAVEGNVEIDDHTAMIDRVDKTADVYYSEKSKEEYDKFVDDVDRGHESFITYFNENKAKKAASVKLSLADNAAADYVLKVKVDKMNVGNAGGVAWGMNRKAGGVQIEGTMQLVDNRTGSVVCEFAFSEVKGMMAPVFRARVISVYRYLADELLKAVK